MQNFTHLGNAVNWYISAIWIFYILAPYFKELIDKINDKIVLWCIIALLVFSVAFWTANTLIITVTRIPIFFGGMYLGKKSYDGCKLTGKGVICLIILAMIGFVGLGYCYAKYEVYLWSYGLHGYPFLLITPGLCLFITYITYKIKVMKKFVDIVGMHSFEIYLIH